MGNHASKQKTSDLPDRIQKLLEKAQQGDAAAQRDLGAYYMSRGNDKKEAVKWYRKAAKQNDSEAQFNLGVCYFYGRGVEKDEKEAVKWIRKAAEQNHAGAQNNLGTCYAKGTGVAKDAKEGVKWIRKAAEQNIAGAQHNLGECYDNGTGVEKDKNEAKNWYRKARVQYHKDAEQNDVHAQLYLGDYYSGEHDICKAYSKCDIGKAVMWYEKAAAQGYEYSFAKTKASRLRKDFPYDFSSQVVFQPVAPPDTLPHTSPTAPPAETPEIKMAFKPIEYTELKYDKELGRGGFGIVYQGTWRFQDIAIKELAANKLSDETVEDFKNESHIMMQLHSDYLTRFYGYCLSPRYCLVMEYLPKGSLYGVLHSKQTLDWGMRLQIATDIACGVAFLHKENILHRDIKSLNVLLTENMRAKLCDFGLSKVKNETKSVSTKNSSGTVAWMAPELFTRKGKQTQKSDIYSMGITFWEVASRKRPFEDAADPAIISTWVTKGARDDIPQDCPKKLASLIRFCWEGDSAKRPQAEQVVTYLKSGADDFEKFTSPSSQSESDYQDNLHSVKIAI